MLPIYAIHFGDYYNDGHGRYSTIYFTTSNIQKVYEAQEEIINKNICLAKEYEETSINEEAKEALKETGFTLEQLLENDIGQNYESLDEAFLRNSFLIEEIQAMYLHLLRAYGADIEKYDCPIINLDTSAGYGCFY